MEIRHFKDKEEKLKVIINILAATSVVSLFCWLIAAWIFVAENVKTLPHWLAIWFIIIVLLFVPKAIYVIFQLINDN